MTQTPCNTPPSGDLVLVWDPLVRLFHWSLALGFAITYLTEDDLLAIHVWAGYVIFGLILFRLVWGFVGPTHARWTSFIKAPSAVMAYIRDAVRDKPERCIGHNPAGGAMIVALLASLVATGVSGLAVYGGQELSGPLAGLLAGISKGSAHTLEEVHEVLANLTLLLVLLHLAGVLYSSWQHRENLPRAMITGRKRREDNHLA